MNKLKNNKDGSAILWTILFTNILVILIGSLLTVSMGYHKATIETVKKQQAYFSARSVTDAILSELATNGSGSKLMPDREGESIVFKDVNFIQNKKAEETTDAKDEDGTANDAKNEDETATEDVNMGTATATIEKVTKNKVEVTVDSKYADSDYKMTANLKAQPIEFGGIAVKNLSIPQDETFKLTDNTDLYIDSEFTGKLEIGGNLICNGDIKLLDGSSVNGMSFDSKTILDDKKSTSYPRKIIRNANQYVISNQKLTVDYTEMVQTKQMLIKSMLKGDYNRQPCNNVYGHGFDFNDNFVDNFSVNDYKLNNNVRYIKITNRVKGYDEDKPNYGPEYISDVSVSLVNSDNKYFKNIGFFDPTSIKQGDHYFTDENNKFIISNLINHSMIANVAYGLEWKNYVLADKLNYNHDYPFGWDNWGGPYGDGVASNTYWRKDTFDARQIDYNTHGDPTKNDKVSSIAYVMVDNGCNLRVMYGLDRNLTWIGDSFDDLYKLLTNEKVTYLYVYLGDNSILELGKGAGNDQRDKDALNFYMSVYGRPGSKVILHKNVKLHGEVNVDDLVVKGSDKSLGQVDFMTSNGQNVNKQKVDELWTISNYSG